MPAGVDLKVLVVLVAVQTSMAVHSIAVLVVVVQAAECSRKENEVSFILNDSKPHSMFTWGLFQTDMTRKKEIPALRNEERGLLFCLIKSSRLESELVTYSNLDYVVVTFV